MNLALAISLGSVGVGLIGVVTQIRLLRKMRSTRKHALALATLAEEILQHVHRFEVANNGRHTLPCEQCELLAALKPLVGAI